MAAKTSTTNNSSPPPLTFLITGCTSGFGQNLALNALASNHTVLGTCRSLSKLSPLLSNHPNFHAIEIGLSEPAETVLAAITGETDKHERIDVLVNNAGYVLSGALEEISEPELALQMHVNFVVPTLLTRALLPRLRSQAERDGGERAAVLNVSSIAGIGSGPGIYAYSASKFALEGASEALYLEVKPFGIRVHCVEPGYFRTNFLAGGSGGGGVHAEKKVEGYGDIHGFLAGANQNQPGDPEKGAKAMYELAVNGKNRGLRVPLGSDSIKAINEKLDWLKRDVEEGTEMAQGCDIVE